MKQIKLDILKVQRALEEKKIKFFNPLTREPVNYRTCAFVIAREHSDRGNLVLSALNNGIASLRSQ